MSQARNLRGRKNRTTPSMTAGGLVIVALIALSALPLTFGVLRVIELAGGAARMPHNARFLAAPLPVLVHIASVTVYALLGAFQFANGWRQRWPALHRTAGRVVVVSGLLVGLSALWMTLFYPRPPETGELLYLLRLFFGAAMLGSVGLGFSAILRGQVAGHRAWMMRAYAIALGAGTQVFTGMLGAALLTHPTVLSGALLMGAGWVINLAVAEFFIRRTPLLPASLSKGAT